jgi:hypothetical protein
VHVNRVDRANTAKQKIKGLRSYLPWFSGTPYVGTQQNRSDKMHRQQVPDGQPDAVSQLMQAYASRPPQ